LGGAAARETAEAGARTQAEIEKLKRDALQKEFKRQIERQQPFLKAGVEALPEFISAISGRGGDVMDLPATQIQGDLISEFLGEEAPGFVKERALTNLGAVEAERRKGRLADLVSAGLGGALSTVGAGVNLGTTLSRSLARECGIRGQALQESATARQNLINQAIGQLSGLPAFIAGARGPAVAPTITHIPDPDLPFTGQGPIQPLTTFRGR
jgi:hypothetical protein